jgi:predicted  nucleic acid-binding Zn-ribbon protein
MMELERRVTELEMGKQYDATQAAVRQVQEEYLLKFRALKAQLEQEQGQMTNNNISSSKELQELRTEYESLKKTNAKLEYRVQHMVTHMESMLKELGQLRQQQQSAPSQST